MNELKLFALRLAVAAFLVAVCLTVSRAADSNEQSDLTNRLAASTKVVDEVMATPDQAIPTGLITRAACAWPCFPRPCR